MFDHLLNYENCILVAYGKDMATKTGNTISTEPWFETKYTFAAKP
jgi:hypothetical protein